MKKETNKKSSKPYLFNCYIWLLNTILRGPISREDIDEKWARANANEYKQNYLPESNFHRWKSTVEDLFEVKIKHNAYNEYYIDEAENLRGTNLRARMLNIISIDSLLNDSKELSDQILFEPVPSGEKFLAPIIEAMRDKCVLQMTYQGFGKPRPFTFPIEPYCLKMFKQRWYVLAYAPDIDKLYVYSLDRIHAIEPTKRKYQLPEDFNAEAYFRNLYGINGIDKEPEEVKISISADQAPYLRTLPLHSSQEEIGQDDKGGVIFRFYIVPSDDFQQELYKYGSDVEILAPKWMRDDFAKDAGKTNERYNH